MLSATTRLEKLDNAITVIDDGQETTRSILSFFTSIFEGIGHLFSGQKEKLNSTVTGLNHAYGAINILALPGYARFWVQRFNTWIYGSKSDIQKNHWQDTAFRSFLTPYAVFNTMNWLEKAGAYSLSFTKHSFNVGSTAVATAGFIASGVGAIGFGFAAWSDYRKIKEIDKMLESNDNGSYAYRTDLEILRARMVAEFVADLGACILSIIGTIFMLTGGGIYVMAALGLAYSTIWMSKCVYQACLGRPQAVK